MKSLRRSDALNNVKVVKLSDDKKFMVLDDVTLKNMKIFKNNYNRTDEIRLLEQSTSVAHHLDRGY
jgi:DNA mismatch repair ATPase MutS